MNVNTIANEIKATSELWNKYVTANKSITDDLAPYGYPGLDKNDIGSYTLGLSDFLEKNAPLIESGADPFLKRSVASLQNVVNNLSSNSAALKDNPGGVIAAIIQGIESLRAPFISNGLASSLKDSSRKTASESTFAVSQLATSLSLATKHLADASVLKAELEMIKGSVEKTKNEIEPLRAVIETNVNETNTKFQQVEENRAKVHAFAEEYVVLKKEYNGLLDLIQSYEKEVSRLNDEHDQQMQKVRNTLEAAERVGLAKSFTTRKLELEVQSKLWLGMLIVSLVCLFVVGICFINPAIKGTIGTERLIALISEIPLTAPFIWLAWYAATQLGFNLRLSEDYSFKVASALALDGYKKEATLVDKELEKRLLEGAIGNFSENPIRIFNKKDVNGSPWQDLFKHPEVREKFKAFTDVIVSVSKR